MVLTATASSSAANDPRLPSGGALRLFPEEASLDLGGGRHRPANCANTIRATAVGAERGYRGGSAWRVISVAITSVMRSMPSGKGVSCSRRVIRTWRATELGGGSGVRLRWSL